jgi:hypothetical protein
MNAACSIVVSLRIGIEAVDLDHAFEHFAVDAE